MFFRSRWVKLFERDQTDWTECSVLLLFRWQRMERRTRLQRLSRKEHRFVSLLYRRDSVLPACLSGCRTPVCLYNNWIIASLWEIFRQRIYIYLIRKTCANSLTCFSRFVLLAARMETMMIIMWLVLYFCSWLQQAVLECYVNYRGSLQDYTKCMSQWSLY